MVHDRGGGAWGLPAGSLAAPARVIALWLMGAPGAVGTRNGDVPKLYAYPVEAGLGTGLA